MSTTSTAGQLNRGLQPLLSRMPVGWRLFIATMVLLVPLCSLGYSYIEEKNAAIREAQLEKQGFGYLNILHRLTRHLARHRGLANLYLNGNAAALADMVKIAGEADKDFIELAAADSRLGDVLKTRESLRAIQLQWNQLNTATPTLTVEDSFSRHTALVRQALDLNDVVAASAGMTTDPRAVTSCLTDAFILRGPEFMEKVSQLRGRASGLVQKGTPLTQAERMGLSDGSAGVLEHSQGFHRALANVYRDLPSARAEIDAKMTASDAALNEFLDTIGRLARGEAPGLDAMEVFNTATGVLSRYYDFDDSADRIFGAVLDEAIVGLQHQARAALALIVGAIALSLLIAFIAVQSVLRPVRHLVGVVDRVAAGDENVRTGLKAGDEMGALAEHFDRMLDRHHRREATLKESERRLSSLLGTMDLASMMLDTQARITYCNDHLLRLTGWQREEVIGQDWFALFLPPDQETGTREVFFQLLQNQPAAWHFENMVITRAGVRRTIRWNSAVLRSETGAVTGIASIGEDVTEQRQAEKKIHRLNRVYAVLSGINSLIVRVGTHEELFREACRIAVEEGGFICAHFTMLHPDTQDWKLAATSLTDPAQVAKLESELADPASPLQALRKHLCEVQQPVHFPAVSNEAWMDTARDLTFGNGTRAGCTMPLIVAGRTLGTMALHSAEAGFFDAEEMKLLLELAGDVAFAMDHISKAERLDYLAHYDVLTGLANRSLFLDRLAHHAEIARATGTRLAVLVLNIDRFKMVNDTLGRHGGDELLRQVAQRFDHDPSDVRHARMSADTFAIVIPGTQTVDEVARRVETMLAQYFDESYFVGGEELRISATLGVSLYPEDGGDAETLFRNAEAALKQAKLEGDRYLFHTRQMTERVAERLGLENRLRQALERQEFVLHYQPKVQLREGRVVGVEALLRWNDPAKGLVPPGMFIPLLEETGLIVEVGSWALRQAASDYKRWTELGFDAPRIAVNVSAVQLRRSDFVEVVRQSTDTGGPVRGIDLEITESLIMEDIAGSTDKLKTLRDMGLNIAIDDFGTGHSSLAYLARLPVRTLKIDRSFVTGMLQERATMTLVSTIVSLSHSLGLDVIAEGVEEIEQARMLWRLRCDQIQGFLFSKAVPFDKMSALIEERFALTP